MNHSTAENKQTVIRFNKEWIEAGKKEAFDEILSEHVINHTAKPGMPNGKSSFYAFLHGILHQAFSDIKVDILDQIAEDDLVTTRKQIHGKHTGALFGIPPTQKNIQIDIIDIIRVKNGQYVDHWGQSNFDEVVNELRALKAEEA